MGTLSHLLKVIGIVPALSMSPALPLLAIGLNHRTAKNPPLCDEVRAYRSHAIAEGATIAGVPSRH